MCLFVCKWKCGPMRTESNISFHCIKWWRSDRWTGGVSSYCWISGVCVCVRVYKHKKICILCTHCQSFSTMLAVVGHLFLFVIAWSSSYFNDIFFVCVVLYTFLCRINKTTTQHSRLRVFCAKLEHIVIILNI